MSGRRHRQLRVTDLPPKVVLVMMLVQSVIGVTVGWAITYGVQRLFLAWYATNKPPAQAVRTRV